VSLGGVSLNVFISVDMEGIVGIATLRQTMRGPDDYAWGREIMTEEPAITRRLPPSSPTPRSRAASTRPWFRWRPSS
jgi:hypothetical protein